MFGFKKIQPLKTGAAIIGIRRGLCCIFTGGPGLAKS